MADIKISQLTAATAATGAMQLEVNDGGASKRVTADQFKAFILADGSVTTAKLATDSVTNEKIASGAVNTDELADGAVTSIKIGSGAVAPSKLSTGAPTWTTGGDLFVTGTGAIDVPAGTTAQRPASPSAGMIRYNSSTASFEGYTTTWGSIGGGAANGVFYENDKTITANYTITSGKNAMSTGEITVASGVSVTVPSGSRWVIL